MKQRNIIEVFSDKRSTLMTFVVKLTPSQMEAFRVVYGSVYTIREEDLDVVTDLVQSIANKNEVMSDA